MEDRQGPDDVADAVGAMQPDPLPAGLAQLPGSLLRKEAKLAISDRPAPAMSAGAAGSARAKISSTILKGFSMYGGGIGAFE